MADEAILQYKPNWRETQERFKAWWNHEPMDRPILVAWCPRETPLGETVPLAENPDPETYHVSVDYHYNRMINELATREYIGDSYPNAGINLGAGSLAVYLGSEPSFHESTIWFKEVVDNWQDWGPLTFDPENPWFKKHLAWTRELVERSEGRYRVNIPDIVENVDILSAMRGPQAVCFDLIDEPELMHRLVSQVDAAYFEAYDRFYDVIKTADGSSTYTAFHLWGPGKTAKVQCDHAALMSPGQFREFVQPSLRRQCDRLDHSDYHLDGKDAICHLDALMEIDSLDVLEWTPGAGKPDGGDPCWYPIYDKVRDAGKSLQILICDDPPVPANQIVPKIDAIVQRYGPDGLYFFIGETDRDTAQELKRAAESKWTVG
jgi:hypothetical protein